MPNSSERRITVYNTLYPKVIRLAERDQVTAADVVNSILLQVLCPYGATPNQEIAPAATAPIHQSFPDPYQTAASVSDWG